MSLTVDRSSATLSRPAVPDTGHRGRIGGMDVRQSAGSSVRRTLTDVAHSVQTFFKGLATRFENWKEGRAVSQATQQAAKAADALATALKTGAIGAGSYGDVEALMRHSARADAAHPDALAGSLIAQRLGAMAPGERTKACFVDMTEVGRDMKALANQRLDRLSDMTASLASAGLGDELPGGDLAAMKRDSDARIDTFVGAIRGELQSQRVGDLNGQAKGVFTFGPDGTVTGQLHNARLPTKLTDGLLPASSGTSHTAGSFIQDMANDRLDKLHDAGPTAAKQPPFTDVGGIKVSDKARGDFHRMNIVFPDTNGQPYNTRLNGDTSQIEPRLATSIANLRALAGSDMATTVLSTVLHQYELREIVHVFAGATGEAVDLKPIQGGVPRAEVRLPNGQAQDFQFPGQIGDAQINLTRTATNDFRIDITWNYLGTSISDGDYSLPSDPSNLTYRPSTQEELARTVNCLKVEMSASFEMSGADAAQGRLTIKPGATFDHRFLGQAAIPN